MGEIVDVDNFVRAETNRMFAGIAARAGGVNRWSHFLEPTPLDAQDVIRMNRDTLYSAVVVDATDGFAVTVPDAGDRYLSVMVIDQDHHVEEVLHHPGEHRFEPGSFATPYVAMAARTLMDPTDATDVAAANAVQHGLSLVAGSAVPFELPDYDQASFTAVREAILALGAANGGVGGRSFGRRGEVDPVRHLIGTALGWGGLPESEAVYQSGAPAGIGRCTITVGEVPVDAFWSISVYNAAGFFEPNDQNSYSVNSVTAERESDGTVVIHLGDWPEGTPNAVPTTEGWNYVARMYRPRPEVVDGSWSFPQPVAAN